MLPMRDWNVVATIHGQAYSEARHLLAEFGSVDKSDYYNVLLMKVDDIPTFMSQLQHGFTATPQRVACLSHVIPVTTTFSFQTAQEFEDKAKKAVQQWLPQLIARSFHIRMHRRGFKGRLSSQHEEQFLDGYILDCLRQEGATAKVSFDDPDLIIVVETVGQQAGLALWTKEDRDRYGFLKLF